MTPVAAMPARPDAAVQRGPILSAHDARARNFPLRCCRSPPAPRTAVDCACACLPVCLPAKLSDLLQRDRRILPRPSSPLRTAPRTALPGLPSVSMSRRSSTARPCRRRRCAQSGLLRPPPSPSTAALVPAASPPSPAAPPPAPTAPSAASTSRSRWSRPSRTSRCARRSPTRCLISRLAGSSWTPAQATPAPPSTCPTALS